MSHCILRLVVNLDVEGAVTPNALAAAHRAAEGAAGLALGAHGVASVLTLQGTMTKTVPRAKRVRMCGAKNPDDRDTVCALPKGHDGHHRSADKVAP